MRRFIKGITVAAASAIFVSGMLAASARSARAQQSDQNDAQYEGSVGAPGAAAQPDKATKAPPININGCWSGTLLDVNSAGPGNGYLNFDQVTNKKGQLQKKLKPMKSSSTHNIDILWNDGSCAFGFGAGVATSTGFHEKLNAGGKCKVTVTGNTTDNGNEITGAHDFRRAFRNIYHDLNQQWRLRPHRQRLPRKLIVPHPPQCGPECQNSECQNKDTRERRMMRRSFSAQKNNSPHKRYRRSACGDRANPLRPAERRDSLRSLLSS